MTHKQKVIVFALGMLTGYVLQNYLRRVPLVNKLPTPGA